MANTRAGDIATDLPTREGMRKHEFSQVWTDELDVVFSDIAPYYDVASNVASLGVFNLWRRRFASSIDIRPGDKVLDVCAGTNGVGIALLQREPRAEVFAIDRNRDMQEVGRNLVRSHGLQIGGVIGDAHHLPFPDDYFDIVTIQWATRHLRVGDLFTEIRRVLRPGGYFYHCDILRPECNMVATAYSAYLNACVAATARLFRSGAEARNCRDYFVRAMQSFYSSREITELLSNLGFTDVSSGRAVGGVIAAHRAVKA